jgi:hypothetical protein
MREPEKFFFPHASLDQQDKPKSEIHLLTAEHFQHENQISVLQANCIFLPKKGKKQSKHLFHISPEDRSSIANLTKISKK